MTQPSLIQKFQENRQLAGLPPDIAQESTFREFCYLHDQIVQSHRQSQLFQRIFKKKNRTVEGLYIWGGVGRGKTYMMDLFFESVPITAKHRIHFHRFMQYIHRELKEKRSLRSPLSIIGKEYARDVQLLCLDEFFVLDIGDAVILANLIQALIDNGVVLVMTSNTKPDDLYKGGIQRDRFLPAIRLINAHLNIVKIADGIDYRLRELAGRTLFHDNLNVASQNAISEEFQRLSKNQETSSRPLEILGRAIEVVQRTEQAVWFDFVQICDGPRSKADYIELANIYRTVMISNIPLLTWEYENQARRFIELVDEFYDHGVHLFATAAAGIDSLYTGKRLVREFQRTSSRLHEMQTDRYLSCTHCG